MKSEKSYWVIISLFVIMLAPLVFISGLVFGLNVAGASGLSADSVSSWVSAIATVAISILTFILAKETWSLRIAQMIQIDEIRKEAVRPSVDLYLLSSPVSFQLMNVHVENNGKGLARNISFEFQPEGKNEFSERERYVVDRLLKINMLANGISSLGFGKQRKSFVFSFLDMKGNGDGDMFSIIVKVKISYYDVDGRFYSTDSLFDFSEYKGVTEVGGGDPNYQIHSEIKKVREILERARGTISSNGFSVNLFTSEDRREELRRMKEFYNEN
ncbi:hypothetical protein [Azospirillum argentinense]